MNPDVPSRQQILGKPEGWVGETLVAVYEVDALYAIHEAIADAMPDWQERMAERGCLGTVVENVRQALEENILQDSRLDEVVAEVIEGEDDEFTDPMRENRNLSRGAAS